MIITNRKQLRTTIKKVADLEQHRAELMHARENADRHSTVIDMELASINEVLEDLGAQVDEYEALEGSRPSEMFVDSLNDLPAAVVRARIAAGLTQAQLAERCGLATSAVERYERDSYSSAGLSRLTEILDAIGIDITVHHSTDPTSSEAAA